jgi:hypothetical protein
MTPIPTPDTSAQKMIELAKAHLSRKFGIAVDRIILTEISAASWPDTSLGCPSQGVSYAAVVTPGYSVMLEAQGGVYTYHTDMNSRVVLCSASAPSEIYLPP